MGRKGEEKERLKERKRNGGFEGVREEENKEKRQAQKYNKKRGSEKKERKKEGEKEKRERQDCKV